MEPFSYITKETSRGLPCDEPLQLQTPLDQKEQEIKDNEIKSDIADIMHSLQHGNHQLGRGHGSKTSGDLFGTGATAVPEVPLLISTAPDGFSATQSSRRARNTQHRPNDVEFTLEIGSSLLAELRRLQTVVTEDEKAIQGFKRAIEELTIALRRQESNAEKYKDEIRTLEVKNTDLQTQLSKAHSNAQHETDLRETSDARKDEAERLVEDLRAKHETDLMQMHMNQASEKKDSETALVALKAKDIAAMREIRECLCALLFVLGIILLLLVIILKATLRLNIYRVPFY